MFAAIMINLLILLCCLPVHFSTTASKSTSHGPTNASKPTWKNSDTEMMSLLRSLKSDIKEIKSEVGAMKTKSEAGMKTIQTKIENVAAGEKVLQTKIENVAAGEKVLQTKIENVAAGEKVLQTKIENVQSKITAMKEDVAYLQASEYASYPGVFLGRGLPKHWDDRAVVWFFEPHAVTDCMEACYGSRKIDKQWNGVVFSLGGQCVCYKNDIGHRNDSRCLHYRFM